jgi:hypothetical protein
MKLLTFFRSKKKDAIFGIVPDSVDKSSWTGKDFYFLITGMVQLQKEEYDKIMTPTTFEWSRLSTKWPIYNVGKDEYGFSFEKSGIEMTFSEKIEFSKAKQIANEIIENICSTGQKVELHVVVITRVYRKGI